jgi:hypothetical protein
VGGGLHLERRHGGGRSSDALAATQLLEEDDDLRCLFEAVRGRLGSRRAAKLGRFGGLRSTGRCFFFSALSIFYFAAWFLCTSFDVVFNSVLQDFDLAIILNKYDMFPTYYNKTLFDVSIHE